MGRWFGAGHRHQAARRGALGVESGNLWSQDVGQGMYSDTIDQATALGAGIVAVLGRWACGDGLVVQMLARWRSWMKIECSRAIIVGLAGRFSCGL